MPLGDAFRPKRLRRVLSRRKGRRKPRSTSVDAGYFCASRSVRAVASSPRLRRACSTCHLTHLKVCQIWHTLPIAEPGCTPAMWRCGGVAVWRCGGVAVWRCPSHVNTRLGSAQPPNLQPHKRRNARLHPPRSEAPSCWRWTRRWKGWPGSTNGWRGPWSFGSSAGCQWRKRRKSWAPRPAPSSATGRRRGRCCCGR